MRILKKPLFQKQLHDIFDRTADVWGIKQAEKYVKDIQDAITQASRREKVWRKFNTFSAPPPRPVYSITCGKHLIFFEFLEEEDTMVLLAIFHQVMNIPEHLKNVIQITHKNP